MARRADSYRILDDEFHKFLSARDAAGIDRWPAQAKLFSYLRETLEIAASERDYTVLRQHGVAPDMLLRGMIFYLAQLDRRTLAAFERIGDELSGDPNGLTEALSMQVSREFVRNHRLEDVSWLDIPALIGGAIMPDEPFCRTPDEVDEACEWTFLEVGRLLALERRVDPTPDTVHALAAEAMRRPLEIYQQQSRAWWKVHPWIVSRIVLRSEPFATATVVPLKPQAYEALRDGDLADCDICAEDLCVPTRHLLMYALADRPRTKPPRFAVRESATKLFAMYWQVAELSGELRAVAPTEPMHLLAVGLIAERRPALQRAGWVPLDAQMRGMGAPLMQLTMPAPGTTNTDGSIASNLQRWAIDRVVSLVRRSRRATPRDSAKSA